MKKTILVALILTSITLSAQPRKNHSKKSKHHLESLANMSAEQLATLKTKKMTLDLDLDNAQQKDVYEMNLANSKERKMAREKREKGKENDATGKRSDKDRYNNINAKLDKEIASKRQMKGILSDEQFKKWERRHQMKKRQKRNKIHVSKRRH